MEVSEARSVVARLTGPEVCTLKSRQLGISLLAKRPARSLSRSKQNSYHARLTSVAE